MRVQYFLCVTHVANKKEIDWGSQGIGDLAPSKPNCYEETKGTYLLFFQLGLLLIVKDNLVDVGFQNHPTDYELVQEKVDLKQTRIGL